MALKIERTDYKVLQTGYTGESVLTTTIRNTTPFPTDYLITVRFYKEDKEVGTKQKAGFVNPMDSMEVVTKINAVTTKAKITLTRAMTPFIVEDEKEAYPE